MASRTEPNKYARRAMYNGSAAYDLERQGWYDPQPEEKRQKPAQPAPRAQAAARPQTAYGFSLMAALGSAVAAVLVVFVLLAYVNYTDVSSDTLRLERQLSELNEAERRLTIRYEETFDITEVEAYATGTLAMSKPSEAQTTELRLGSEDRAEVLSESGGAAGEAGLSIGGMAQFFAQLTSYIKASLASYFG